MKKARHTVRYALLEVRSKMLDVRSVRAGFQFLLLNDRSKRQDEHFEKLAQSYKKAISCILLLVNRRYEKLAQSLKKHF